MAGLFAANVLADHFEQVIVVERDQRPGEEEWRRGVPQSRHVHVLLLRGVQILRRRFPGLEEELLAQGAQRLNWLKDTAALAGDAWLPRFDSNLIGYSASRSQLERAVRSRLGRRENIDLRSGHRVTNLCANKEKNRVTGVNCTVAGDPVTLNADLVVDASGRSSRLPEWLQKLGYAPPQESTVNADVGYATRWYRIPDGWKADWKMVLLATRYPDVRGGAVVQPIEGRRWVVTLVGYAGEEMPTDEAGFEAFARTLAGPQVWEAIRAAEPISGIFGYRRTENRWRRYERLKRWPQGLAAVGEAVCAFNPVYAQGMTVSALSAEVLDEALRRGAKRDGGDAAPLFQRELARMLRTPWRLASGDDFRWAGPGAGDAAFLDRLMHGYVNLVLDRIHRPDVCLTFFNVAHLISPPTALFRPGLALPIAGSAATPLLARAWDALLHAFRLR